MKKRVILSSILTIAMCISLIAGATSALFTSESNNDIAITSGAVDVDATVTLKSVYSPTAIDPADSSVIDPNNAVDPTSNVFKNGGDVEVVGTSVNLNKLTPGDKAILEVAITNMSTVSFMQRIALNCKEADNVLFNNLIVGISDTADGEYKYYKNFATAWEDKAPVANEGTPEVSYKYISVELPAFAGNECQDKSCTLTLTVNAVQGNANATDAAIEDIVYIVSSQAELDDAIANVKNGGTIVIDESFGDVSIAYDDAKTINVIGAKLGKVTVTAPNGTVHIYNDASEVVGENVAMHSLYIHGEVAKLDLKAGRAVVAEGAKVEAITVNATNGDVKVLVEDGAVKVGSVSVDSVDGINKVSVELPKNDNVPAKVETNISSEDYQIIETSTSLGNNFTAIKNTEDSLIITTADELFTFATNVTSSNTYKNKTVYLAANIDLSDKNWAPAGASVNGSFQGTFDGLGYTISNMSAVNNTGYGNGFFGTIISATIKNVTFENARVSRYENDRYSGNVYGIVAGYSYGSSTFENVNVVNSKVVGFGKVGAILGMSADPGACVATFKNCSVTNTEIMGTYNVGNLAGYILCQAVVENCVAEGTWVRDNANYTDVNTTVTAEDGTVIEVEGVFWVYDASLTYDYAAWGKLYCQDINGELLSRDDIERSVYGITVNK